MNKLFLLALLISIKCKAISPEDVLLNSANFYKKHKTFSYTATYKWKSAIANDTTITVAKCALHLDRNISFSFFLPESNVTFIKKEEKYLFLLNEHKVYKSLKPKEADRISYNSFLHDFPFENPSSYFKNFASNPVGFESNFYILSDGYKQLYFDTENYSLRKIVEFAITSEGIQYTEKSIIYNSFSDSVENLNIDVVMAGFKQVDTFEDIIAANKPIKLKVGDQFPPLKIKSVNDRIYDESIFKNKYVLLDFFYESCGPCILSFPAINKLFDKVYSTKFLILGIDPNLGDTLNIKKFIARYGIKYDVIIGKDANLIHDLIQNDSYPTVVFIDKSGKVKMIHSGKKDELLDRFGTYE